MAEEAISHPMSKRLAVITGANKGIGLEISRQLASNGVMVILTARDEKKGLEGVAKLKESGLSDVVFHQLDVKDSISISSLADFIKTQFGKLDILVNNAGVGGVIVDCEALRALKLGAGEIVGEKSDLVKGVMQQTYEKAEECLKTNYYGCKAATEALLPLLQLSSSARIVNVSSDMGQLKVNNAGDGGVIVDSKALRALKLVPGRLDDEKAELAKGVTQQTYEKAEECLKTNYYGCKAITEELPLLLLSSSARIVNVSSSMGQLKYISNPRAREYLDGVDGPTEEKVEEVLQWFLKDFKEDLLGPNGWPTILAAYSVSKAALNAYTRILAKRCPGFCINCVDPGFVKTDMNCNTGILTVEDGAKAPVMLSLLPDGGPSGQFFDRMKLFTFAGSWARTRSSL